MNRSQSLHIKYVAYAPLLRTAKLFGRVPNMFLQRLRSGLVRCDQHLAAASLMVDIPSPQSSFASQCIAPPRINTP